MVKRKVSFVIMWLIYILTVIVMIKWGIYDTFIESEMTLMGSLMFPFIIIIKLFICAFVSIMLLALNALCFTNAFKN